MQISSHSLATALATVLLIVGLGTLATVVISDDDTTERSGVGEPCTADDETDCSVIVRVETEADDGPVDEQVKVDVTFGSRSTQSNGDRNRSVDSLDDVTAEQTLVLEPGDRAAGTPFEQKPGYSRYYVQANMRNPNSTNWTVHTRNKALSLPSSQSKYYGFRGSDLEGDGRVVVVFNLTRADGRGGSVPSSWSLFPFALDRSVLGLLLIGAVGAGLVGMFALSMRTQSDQTADSDGPAVSDVPDQAAIGQIAGEAADRIDDAASHENAVYRAWHEMVDELNIRDPETVTPGEFAEYAVRASLDDDDVRELTGLFEKVRYGDRDPDDYEEQALATLRRIEVAYADEGDDP